MEVQNNKADTGTLPAAAILNEPTLITDTQKAPPSTKALEQMEEQPSAQASSDNSQVTMQAATSTEQTSTQSTAGILIQSQLQLTKQTKLGVYQVRKVCHKKPLHQAMQQVREEIK